MFVFFFSLLDGRQAESGRLSPCTPLRIRGLAGVSSTGMRQLYAPRLLVAYFSEVPQKKVPGWKKARQTHLIMGIVRLGIDANMTCGNRQKFRAATRYYLQNMANPGNRFRQQQRNFLNKRRIHQPGRLSDASNHNR